jgi:hypothetical protein
MPTWEPLKGPQSEALDCDADHLFYGGAAGGGKTDLLLGAALTRHRRSIIFRREFAQLKGIRERAEEIYGPLGKFNGQLELWRIEAGEYRGRRVEFGACQNTGDETKYQGRPHDLKAFDEITHFTEQQFRFIITWNRTAHPGQRTRVICAGNPPTDAEGDWVIKYWAPWLDPTHPNPAKPGELRWFVSDPINGGDIEVPSGDPVLMKDEDGFEELVQPKSRSFIFARVEDNPYLMTSGYKATLQALPEPLRSRMLRGMFGAGQEDADWQVIPSAWVQAAQKRWEPTYEAFLARVARERAESLAKTPEISTETASPEANPAAESAERAETALKPLPLPEVSAAKAFEPEDLRTLTREEIIARAEATFMRTQEAPNVDLKSLLEGDPVAEQVAEMAELSRRSRRVGVDVARGGRDRTVITEALGPWFSQQTTIPGKQTPDGLSVIQKLVSMGYQDAELRIDVSNIGSSPVDLGRMYKLNIIAMNGAEKSTAKDKSGKLGFANKRAEWLWKLREALDPANGIGLALPPDPELLADLTAPRWKLTRQGILIEEKNEIKARIGRSTDKGDSLVVAHAKADLVAGGFLDFYEQEVQELAAELQRRKQAA